MISVTRNWLTRFAPQEHGEQDEEADALAQCRGEARAAGAHLEPKDEERVQHDVEHAARHKADHGKAGLALIPQDVVHYKAGHHQRGRKQDGPGVGTGVGQDGVRAAQQHHKAGQGGKAAHGQHGTHRHGREKAGGGKFGGRVGILIAQAAADDATGPVAEHEAQCLDNGHQAGNDAHRARSAGGKLADKKRIGQVVDAGDEHTQDGGGGKAQDQSGDGRLGHFMVLLLAELVGGHGQNSFRCKLPFRHGKAALAMPKSGRNRTDS